MGIYMLKNSHRIDLDELISNWIKKSIPLMVSVCICIVIIKGVENDFVIKALSINTEQGLFLILTKLSQYSIIHVDLLWIIFCVCLGILFWGIYLNLKDYYKNKLLIIKHSSFNAMNFHMDNNDDLTLIC